MTGHGVPCPYGLGEDVEEFNGVGGADAPLRVPMHGSVF
jgi:hypothetical protein